MDSEPEERQVKRFNKGAKTALLLCAVLASVGMFSLGQTASTKASVVDVAATPPAPPTDCKVGQYGWEGQCLLCPSGKYQPNIGKTRCLLCGAGTVNPGEGQSICHRCDVGEVQPIAGKTHCKLCAAGKFNPSRAMTKCVDCEIGKFARGAGEDKCYFCDAGKYQPGLAATGCVLCDAGMIQPNTGKDHCKACRAGTVMPTRSGTKCETCTPGKIMPTAAGTRCIDCEPGTMTDSAGALACVTCPAGKIQPTTRGIVCTNCKPGYHSAKPMSTRCTRCIPGTVSPSSAAVSCEKCESGTIAAGYQETLCQECEPGTYQSKSGAASCTDCELGKWQGHSKGTECDAWTVCAGSGEAGDSSKAEGVGRTGTSKRDVSCVSCGPGEISITGDTSSGCTALQDSDGDGMFDRFLGEGEAFDHNAAPSTGGEYDRCPFDVDNDVDDDGICGGSAPPAEWHTHLENDKFYPKGAWHVDLCPDDPTNNVDKDFKCDNKDKELITWNFFSNTMEGWTGRETSSSSADAENQPFGVGKESGEIPGQASRFFVFDLRVHAVCEKSSTMIKAVLGNIKDSTTRLYNCHETCKDHGMVCNKAAPVPPHAEGEEQCDDREMHHGGCEKSYVGSHIMCECGYDDEPIHTEDWSGAEVCPSCYASTKGHAVGMMSAQFKITKNTIRFRVAGGSSPANFVQLKIMKDNAAQNLNDPLGARDKATKGMPSIIRPMDAAVNDGEWYLQEMDVSDFIDKDAVLQVQHSDGNTNMSFDTVEFADDGAGCLPSCMTIRHSICNGGDTCLHFEEDKAPWIKVKATDEKGESGLWCRAGQGHTVGGELGAGISQMGQQDARGNPQGTTENLGLTTLPNCLHVDFGVNAPAQGSDQAKPYYVIGIDAKDAMHFQYDAEPSMDNTEVHDVHCIYKTAKPRCMAYTKPNLAFSKASGTVCKGEIVQPGSAGAEQRGSVSCYAQCMNLFCSKDTHGAHQKHADSKKCGSKDSFDNCAMCCDDLKEGEGHSACHSGHRRRLVDTIAEKKGKATKDAKAKGNYGDKHRDSLKKLEKEEGARAAAKHNAGAFTSQQCAEECLGSPGCMGYMLTNGVCVIAHECDPHGHEDDGFQKGGWKIKNGTTKKQLGNVATKRPGSKKRKGPKNPDAPKKEGMTATQKQAKRQAIRVQRVKDAQSQH